MNTTLLTKAEAAALLRVSVRQVSRLMATGRLPYVKTAAAKSGRVLFHKAEVLARIDRNTVTA